MSVTEKEVLKKKCKSREGSVKNDFTQENSSRPYIFVCFLDFKSKITVLQLVAVITKQQTFF